MTGGRHGRFYVADNGIGVAEGDRKAIWTAFRRIKTGRDHGPGSGVGLTFVKRIVEGCRGEIDFDSAVGQGTMFIFILPLSDKVQADGTVASAGTKAGRS
ncbi:MAG: sensor histidine kinase [Sagittula sp.]|uniref:sensor histidine kinase n=1 Tax=Sagittula sp. TaxID=2038081 RepID=UPI004059E643